MFRKSGMNFCAGEVLAIQIAAGERDAGDADLADLAVRNDLVLVLVEDDDRVGRERHADGHRPVGDQHADRRAYRAFRRSVGVQDAPVGPVPADDEMVRHGLAGQKDHADVRQVLFDSRPKRRDAGKDRDAVLEQEIRADRRRRGSLRTYPRSALHRRSAAPKGPRHGSRRRASCPDRRGLQPRSRRPRRRP